MAPSYIKVPQRDAGAGANLSVSRPIHMATTTLRVGGMT